MAAIPKKGVPFQELMRITLTRIVPAGFVVGAGIETFMNLTGFYGVATRKAAERQAEVKAARRELASSPARG